MYGICSLCTGIPIIFTITCYFSENEDLFWKTSGAVLETRVIRNYHFAKDSERFDWFFGRFEMIIKSVTLSFFLGFLFHIWRSEQAIRNLNGQVHKRPKSALDKYNLNLIKSIDKIDWWIIIFQIAIDRQENHRPLLIIWFAGFQHFRLFYKRIQLGSKNVQFGFNDASVHFIKVLQSPQKIEWRLRFDFPLCPAEIPSFG